MSDAATIVAIVSIVGCLVLATRSLWARNLGSKRLALMGVAWAAIIAVLAFVLQKAAA
jgi:hypothetical protein